MAIIDYQNCSRDTHVQPPNVYLDNGQGCGTVWFYNAADANRALKANGGVIPRGSQAGLCSKCACHYSYGTAEFFKYPQWACRLWKDKWTDNPKTGPKKKGEAGAKD